MSSLLKNLQRTAPSRRSTEVDVPRGFVDFCGWLGVHLTPGAS
jgi:hypothetical protein